MTTTANHAPTGIRGATPYLAAKNAAAAIEFYRRAFGAVEIGESYVEPSGRVGHAELAFGDVRIAISDEFPEIDVRGPQSRGGATSALILHVDDPDAVFERAVAAGATVIRPLKDEPYGRTGKLADPFGHIWFING